jgi:serine/threonine protein kinase
MLINQSKQNQPPPPHQRPPGDLSGFIKAAAASGRPLPEGTVWQIFLQLCQGMQAVHDSCVIHRDIKPANIFMCPDNIVKVGRLPSSLGLLKRRPASARGMSP